MAETYDMTVRNQIKVHPFPIAKGVALAGKADADDADISLKRGTVLASARNVDGVVIYKPCTNWAADTENLVNAPIIGDEHIGTLPHTYIAPNAGIGLGSADGVFTNDDAGTLRLNVFTGEFKVVIGIDDDNFDYDIEYEYGDEDGGTWPVGVLLVDVDIDSTDDVENVPVLVKGGISKDDLIYPTITPPSTRDSRIRAFVAALQYNGIFAR